MRLNITAAGLLALAVLVGFDRVLEGSTGLALPGQSGPRIFVPSPSAKLWLNDNPLIAEDTREPLKGKTAANTPPEIMSGWPLTESTTQALSIPPLRAKVPVYLFESVLNLEPLLRLIKSDARRSFIFVARPDKPSGTPG